MKRPKQRTPVRSALDEKSSLAPLVSDGMGAVKNAHRNYFDASIRPAIADSLDIDEAMKKGREHENRWDYLLGHEPSGAVVAVEPHSAKDDEIETLIRKRTAARQQLREHLRDGIQITRWLWVASGKVRFADTEKARRSLDQNGIEFAGTKVSGKHLPQAATRTTGTSDKPGRRKKR